jgi:hypothetical protein
MNSLYALTMPDYRLVGRGARLLHRDGDFRVGSSSVAVLTRLQVSYAPAYCRSCCGAEIFRPVPGPDLSTCSNVRIQSVLTTCNFTRRNPAELLGKSTALSDATVRRVGSRMCGRTGIATPTPDLDVCHSKDGSANADR